MLRFYLTSIRILNICTQVTKVKLEQKQREGTAEARGGRRSLVCDAFIVQVIS